MTDEKLPEKPSKTAKLRAADLALLEEDARRLTVRERPAQDVLWTQLLKPRGAVLRAYRELLRAWTLSDADASPGAFAGLLDGEAAITAIATATVAKAMLGDPAMIQAVYDRIEGRPGQRRDDDTDQGAARRQAIDAVERAVRAMNRRPGDGAQVIDVEPSKITQTDDGPPKSE